MTPSHLFRVFKTQFPWYTSHIVKYKPIRGNEINIYLDNGEVLNFVIEKNGWTLKRGDI